MLHQFTFVAKFGRCFVSRPSRFKQIEFLIWHIKITATLPFLLKHVPADLTHMEKTTTEIANTSGMQCVEGGTIIVLDNCLRGTVEDTEISVQKGLTAQTYTKRED